MGQWIRRNGVAIGRIGYERAGDLAELWDPSVNDFRETRLKEGLTSPFALDLEKFRVVFQLRAGRIQPTSFTGAFRSLLNEAVGKAVWRVTHDVVGETLDEWIETVRHVDRLEIRLERPNPDYHGRDAIERLIEGTRAEMAKIILDASDEEIRGLNLDDDFVRQAIEHGQAYGKIKAVATVQVQQRSREVQWRSEVEGSPKEARVEADPATREALPDELERVLEEPDDSTDPAT
jgi:hypothetical protein